jgi:hypothetical protein
MFITIIKIEIFIMIKNIFNPKNKYPNRDVHGSMPFLRNEDYHLSLLEISMYFQHLSIFF